MALPASRFLLRYLPLTHGDGRDGFVASRPQMPAFPFKSTTQVGFRHSEIGLGGYEEDR